MWILIAALPIGMFLGLIAGGTFGYVRELEVRAWYLMIPATAIVALMAVDRDPPVEWLLLPAALVLFAILAFRNMAIVGMTVVGVGILANLVPVLLNGEMPVREKAVIQAGLADASNIDLVRLGAGRRFEETGDVLVGLGAIIPLEPVREVVTFGDLIVIAGLINVGFRVIKPLPRHRIDEVEVRAVSLAEALGVAAPRIEPEVLAHEPPRQRDEARPSNDVFGSDQTIVDLTAGGSEIHLDDLPTFVEGSATWGD